jgi:serine/threonine protein kinase
VLFIAMRYVPGGDVRTLVHREGPLSPGRTAAIISPVASALEAAHAAGLVHRDVKPANMLVDERPGRPDHVYLSDFGLSRGAVSSLGLTGSGQILGTLDYIPPEQIEGKPVDGRADEYALACAAFELLTGGPPFRRDEATAVLYAQLSQPPPLLTSRRPDLPPAADRVFARALAKAPGDRYPTCREFADALRAAFGLAPYDPGPRGIPAAGRPPTQIASPTARGVPHERIPGDGAADMPVTTTGTSGNTQTCSRPVCHQTFHMHVLVPAAALKSEISKQWYPYSGLNLAPAKEPASPTVLLLGAGDPHVTKSQQVSADESDVSITFSFRIGTDAYSWNWNICSTGTEAEDGIGLPGHHGCGSERVLASASYLG